MKEKLDPMIINLLNLESFFSIRFLDIGFNSLGNTMCELLMDSLIKGLREKGITTKIVQTRKEWYFAFGRDSKEFIVPSVLQLEPGIGLKELYNMFPSVSKNINKGLLINITPVYNEGDSYNSYSDSYRDYLIQLVVMPNNLNKIYRFRFIK